MSRSRTSASDPPRSRWVEFARQFAVPVVALALCGLVIALVHNLSHDLDYRAMVRALRQLPMGAIGLSIGATAVSFAALAGREFCALRYVGARVPMMDRAASITSRSVSKWTGRLAPSG